jgi:peptidoglycan/LPS O-acetylase OafA/YrhL
LKQSTIATKEEKRIGRLDGIRTIAIALVFAHHAGFLPIGWTGVTLFFVLSGLLITGILRRAQKDRAFWGPFYIKRAARILPPLVIAFAGAAIFCAVPWRTVGLYHLFFLSNLCQVIHPGQSQTLNVLWSLSVEEHYYLVWPFAIRFLKRKQLIRLLLGLIVLEPVLRASVTPFCRTWEPVYFLTPFQLDGLAAGSLLSLLVEDDQERGWIAKWSAWLVVPSLLAIVGLSRLVSFQRETNDATFNSLGYSLAVLFSVSLIGYVLLQKDTWVSRVLGSKLLVFFGSISYGIYLFHGLGLMLVGKIAIMLHSTDHVQRLIPLTLIPIVAASWLSFRFYETPLIRWGRKKARALEVASEAKVPMHGGPPSVIAQG